MAEHDYRLPHANATILSHRCTTQLFENDPTAIQVGYDYVICLWTPGTIIYYYVKLSSFKNDADGHDVSISLLLATNAWAELPVSFKQVDDPELADFTVVYQPRQLLTGGNYPVYATSFFPNSDPASRQVNVYSLALQNRDALVGVLCHEIGHVLGLRHEFAAWREPSHPSVQWGPANPESIMNYYANPLELAVHYLDLHYLRKLYEFALSNPDPMHEGYYITFTPRTA
jgi:hypothetical protein